MYRIDSSGRMYFPRGTENNPESLILRLLAGVDTTDPDKCWNWQKCHGRYAKIRVNGKTLHAHKLLYELFIGPVRDGMELMHSCDNTICINPSHLSQGTHQDNMDDRDAKGRAARFIGEKHPGAKLTNDMVLDIKNKFRDGVPDKEIATEYGIGRTAINKIRNGVNWSHLK